MLSRSAAPNSSGPPEASCPSSKTIWILWTVPVIGTSANVGGLNPITTPPTPQRSLIHPWPTVSMLGGGELQPTKKNPSVVTTSNRGAPAPQCDPRTPAWVSGGSNPGFL